MPDTQLNLFVLTDINENRVMRVSVTQELQKSITELLLEQEERFFSGIEEGDYYKFDGKYRPEERELLYIDEFDDIDKLGAAIADPLGYPELSIENGGLEHVRAVFSGYTKDGKTRVLAQAFDRRRIISPKGFSIIHSKDKFVKFDGTGLTLDNKLTAVLDGQKLLFSSFHFVRTIFDVSGYFKEATDADVKDFCRIAEKPAEAQKAFLDTCDGWIRRKIGLIRQSGILEKTPADQISKVATSFDIEIKTQEIDGKIVIEFPETRAELKRLLRFLDEDYYQSPLSDARYISNSKTVARPAKGAAKA
ncbi:hypothetical protein WS75_10715 [Burkholderia sp. FL-7-2-10-S1-D7]|uniref:Kiwa anti-phage protein KwaB-like domain-containing protein n=1 Tax=Burkholderia sp. FL-7-2-10-S1-D7 TaxID=1637866 RepID=UPI00076D2BA8|nr:Kiwa anti-phage protein KwaB-like domain-containing protein [Burkholderia sp. FL-7-2-10-S1-D7]KVF76855.1 hypothetical protein WS75_10715 [Burkholderia sp. FL-7-2-10-S1-D7]